MPVAELESTVSLDVPVDQSWWMQITEAVEVDAPLDDVTGQLRAGYARLAEGYLRQPPLLDFGGGLPGEVRPL